VVREVLSPATVRRQGFFDEGVVQRLLDDHATGVKDNSRELWALLVFSLWCERYA
jgi:asparagine synthase (glutamine-hydrolysing)